MNNNENIKSEINADGVNRQIDLLVTQRILHLTLKKKWFDLIANGKKKIEYREVKEYWLVRLTKELKYLKYKEIHFTNGYGKDKPFMRVEHLGTLILPKKLAEANNGEDLPERVFTIWLGRILEIKNYKSG